MNQSTPQLLSSISNVLNEGVGMEAKIMKMVKAVYDLEPVTQATFIRKLMQTLGADKFKAS